MAKLIAPVLHTLTGWPMPSDGALAPHAHHTTESPAFDLAEEAGESLLERAVSGLFG